MKNTGPDAKWVREEVLKRMGLLSGKFYLPVI